MGVFRLVSNPSKLEYYKSGLLSSRLLGDFHLPEAISKVILMKYLIMSALLTFVMKKKVPSLILSEKKFILGSSPRQVEIRSHLVCRIISDQLLGYVYSKP
jgi:hypothetical protein